MFSDDSQRYFSMRAVCRRRPLTATRWPRRLSSGKAAASGRQGLRLEPRVEKGGCSVSGGQSNTCRWSRSQGPSPFGAGVHAQPGPYALQVGGSEWRSQRPSLRLPRSKAPNDRTQAEAGGAGGRGGGRGREGGGAVSPSRALRRSPRVETDDDVLTLL